MVDKFNLLDTRVTEPVQTTPEPPTECLKGLIEHHHGVNDAMGSERPYVGRQKIDGKLLPFRGMGGGSFKLAPALYDHVS